LSIVADTWVATGSLETARSQHTATQLPSGQVLVIGGIAGSQDPDQELPELYDPASGTWSSITNLTSPPLVGQTATLLPNGKVLVAGGTSQTDPTDVMTASAELYDPVAGTWTSTGSLITARSGHTATLLPNGLVLVAGGESGVNTLASAELYDPVAGTWSSTGSLASPRFGHTATLLQNGSVLVAGGGNYMGISAEVYDPVAGTWSTTGSLSVPRQNHTATLLPNGMVLVAGGYGGLDNFVVASAELYDPTAGAWSITGSLATARGLHTATLLPNGTVLVAGGIYDSSTSDYAIASAELYDPGAGTWSGTDSLETARAGHTATLLGNGAVLVTGGTSGSDLVSCELYL
jgi:N-acetylneuraminic acid mutarotase